MKMKETEKPSFFIYKMKQMRKQLASEMNYTMSDDDFMKDMLAKFP